MSSVADALKGFLTSPFVSVGAETLKHVEIWKGADFLFLHYFFIQAHPKVL